MDLAGYILSALLISSNATTLAGMHKAGFAVLQHLRQFETADLSSGLRLGWY